MPFKLLLGLPLLLMAVLWYMEPPQRALSLSGLRGGATEFEQHRLHVTRVKRDNPSVIFLGDSITHGWGDAGQPTVPFLSSSEQPGLIHWENHFASLGAANLGYPGDDTASLLWRIRHGDLGKPHTIVLLIGSNDPVYGRSVDDIAVNIETLLSLIKEKAPGAKLLLLSVLPRHYPSEDPSVPQKVRRLNALLPELAERHEVTFVDSHAAFVHSNGTPKRSLFSDGVHLTQEGYRVLAQIIAPLIARP